MIRLAVAAGIAAAAGGVAWWLNRRQQMGSSLGPCPSSIDLDRVGLPGGGVVVFVDAGCRSCEAAVAEVRASGLPHVVVDDVAGRARFGVREVPTTVEVGPDGVVRRGWIGPLPPGALGSV